MESLKNNVEIQQKVAIVFNEINKLENNLKYKNSDIINKTTHIEQLHNESIEYFRNIVENIGHSKSES